MAKEKVIEDLNDAVDALMTDPHATPPRLSPQLTALLRIASDLRDLPSDAFRARLKSALVPEAAEPSYGPPLVTHEDIRARLEALAAGPRLVAHDVRAALSDLPEMTMRFFAPLNRCMVGVSRFAGPSHWERHPAGDEMLHILEGEVEITTLTDEGPVQSAARAGSLFICPRGLWHRLVPRSPVSLLFATPGEGIEHSAAKDPRRPGRGRASLYKGSGLPASAAGAPLSAHDVDATLNGLPELTITASTTGAEADAAVRTITRLDQCMLGVMRYSGLTPWERHPDGDELLHVLDGEVDVTVLAEDGPAEVTVRAGSVFVCPRGLWHRQRPRPAVTMLFGTPSKTTEVSFADDPRHPA